MPVSLANLENRRATVLSELAHLGDMRAGSITEQGAGVEIRTATVTSLGMWATDRIFD